ncbi:MAG: NFACT RNA binding domain-containing protein [Chlorobium sp.]|jgi:predicted ribosome quality control (RQC) complex YloA/Tae2 family protein|nr:MAG: DUF814 domain-containing protein [Chlorobium sp.]
MIHNYFTLYHAAMELHERLAGGCLIEIYSTLKNELTLSFICQDSRHLNIVVVTHTPLFSLSTKEHNHNKPRNSADLMIETCNQRVSSVRISPYDREIQILLADNAIIVLQLFGSKTNVILVRENRITDAFKQKNSLEGLHFQSDNNSFSVLRELEALTMNKTRFCERLTSGDVETLPEKLASVLPGFDSALVKEVMKRWNRETGNEGLFIAFQSVFYEILDPEAAVYENEHGQPVFSLLHGAAERTHVFDSVLEGLTDYSIKMWQFLDTKETLKVLRLKLERELAKKKKALDSFNPELIAEFARNYETFGHLLMSSLYEPRINRQSITVKNIFEPGAHDVTIRLKEALSIQKNAEEYFLKASKTKRKLKAMLERNSRLVNEKNKLAEIIASTENIATPKEARKFVESHAGILNTSKTLPAKNRSSALPFRTVKISTSATLFIGKNAANNDLLTFTYARPNDIWLHARGAAGSHCILKGVSMNQLNEITQAAEIAAWNSAAKHSELVPVIYTLKKYVRHGKNLPAGQVIVEREEVLIVKPVRPLSVLE